MQVGNLIRHFAAWLAVVSFVLITGPTTEGRSMASPLQAEINQAQEVQAPAPAQPLTLTGKTIMLDPGHGGQDPGAQRSGVQEKNLTLAIALKLKADLEKLGATVIMTRSDDSTVALSERADLTNQKQPDIFVSIHINAQRDRNFDGLETYYYWPESEDLAQTLFDALVQGLNEQGNWVRPRGLYVVDHTRIPATLVEVGYMSRAAKLKLLVSADYQQKIADAIADGIESYFAQAPNSPNGHSTPTQSSLPIS